MAGDGMDSAAKIAVVTGASHGIGREIAMTLAERGFTVRGIGLYPRDIAATHEEAKQRSLDVEVLEGDVSKSSEVAKFQRWVEKTRGPLRAICNNAAIRPVGTVLTTSEEDWDRVFAINVKGAYLVLRTLLPAMIGAGGGAIVNIASCSAMGAAKLVAYSASKSALIAMTRCLAEDHKQDRERDNVIPPGRRPSEVLARGRTPRSQECQRDQPRRAYEFLRRAGRFGATHPRDDAWRRRHRPDGADEPAARRGRDRIRAEKEFARARARA